MTSRHSAGCGWAERRPTLTLVYRSDRGSAGLVRASIGAADRVASGVNYRLLVDWIGRVISSWCRRSSSLCVRRVRSQWLVAIGRGLRGPTCTCTGCSCSSWCRSSCSSQRAGCALCDNPATAGTACRRGGGQGPGVSSRRVDRLWRAVPAAQVATRDRQTRRCVLPAAPERCCGGVRSLSGAGDHDRRRIVGWMAIGRQARSRSPRVWFLLAVVVWRRLDAARQATGGRRTDCLAVGLMVLVAVALLYPVLACRRASGSQQG